MAQKEEGWKQKARRAAAGVLRRTAGGWKPHWAAANIGEKAKESAGSKHAA